MKRWVYALLLALGVSSLYGRTVGDIVSLGGDSLRIRPIISLTIKGVIERELRDNKTLAREKFEEALRIDPLDVTANYQMAVLLRDISPEESLPYAQRAMRGDTTNKWCVELYAQNLVMMGRYNEAIPLYQQLLKGDENNLDTYRILAILHQYSSRPYSAIMVIDSAEVRVGRNPYLSRIKQGLLLSTNQEARAVEQAREIVANMPYDISSRLLLAQAYTAIGRDSLAEVEYNIASKIDPSSAELLTALSTFYEQHGRTQEYFDTLKPLFDNKEYEMNEALTLLRRMMGNKSFYKANYVGITELISILALRFPNEKLIVDLRAEHLIAFGMLEQALEMYKRYTHSTPPQREYFDSVIEIESYKKRVDSVELYINRAIELFPEDVELYITKANVKAHAEDLDGAREAYMEAIKLSSSDTTTSELWGFIGDLEYQASTTAQKESQAKKMMRRCFAAYDKALSLYSDNLMVLNNYAYFISEQQGGDFALALEMSSRVVEISKNNPVYLDTHAWVLYRLGRYDEAEKYIRTAISLDKSKSAELHLHYGDILFAQGNYFMAEVYWKRAEALGYSKEEILQRVDSLKNVAQ